MSKDSATPYAAYEPPPSGRDLEAARGAFKSRDVEASRSAHMMSAHKKNAPEMHQTGGEQVKTIVFGGLDGILTAHAVIAAAVGAKLSPAHVLRHAHSRRHGSHRAGHPRLEAPSPSPSRQRQSRKPMAWWRSRARAGLGNRAWSVTVMLGSRSPQRVQPYREPVRGAANVADLTQPITPPSDHAGARARHLQRVGRRPEHGNE